MAKTYKYTQFLDEVHQVSNEMEYLHCISDNSLAIECYNGPIKIKNISTEDLDQDSANKIVDKAFDIAGNLLKATFKILYAIYNKLIQLGKRFKQFLNYCSKRGNVVKNSLYLSQNESNKLIQAIKKKCDEWIKLGITNQYELSALVDTLVISTGAKNLPLDKESPAIVRQWIEGLSSMPGLKFTRVKELDYYITEEVWHLYAYHPRKTVFSEELIKAYTDINNYYLKLNLNIRTWLSQDRLFAMIRETLTGKYNLVKDTVVEELTRKMITPLFDFELPRESGNITDNVYVELSNKTVKSIFENSHDKLKGLEAAITVFTPALIEGNPQLYVPYQITRTNIDEMAIYSTKITKAINNIETNLTHLMGKNGELLKTNLPMENTLQRLLSEVLSDQLTNRAEIILAVVDISRLLEKIIQNVYNYWQELSGKQLKCLDKQQQGLLRFLPLI